MFENKRLPTILLTVLVLILACFLLQYTSTILVPFFLASFITMLILPIIRWLERFIPSWLAFSVIFLFLAIGSMIDSLFFFSSLSEISNKIPEYSKQFHNMLQGVIAYADKYGMHITWTQIGTQKALSWALNFLRSGISSVVYIIGQLMIILFIVIFLILETHQFEKKIEKSFNDENARNIIDTVNSIASQLQQYIFAKTLVSLITGVGTTILLYFLGVDFCLLWGILAFLLNFIPNIGSIIAVIPPILIALLQFNTLGPAIGAFIGLLSIQTVVGYVVDPKVVGHSINLSPLVVFLSMLFWGWIWGVMGMVLAVPLTVSLKIICEHVESLAFISILLGEKSSFVASETLETSDSKG